MGRFNEWMVQRESAGTMSLGDRMLANQKKQQYATSPLGIAQMKLKSIFEKQNPSKPRLKVGTNTIEGGRVVLKARFPELDPADISALMQAGLWIDDGVGAHQLIYDPRKNP